MFEAQEWVSVLPLAWEWVCWSRLAQVSWWAVVVVRDHRSPQWWSALRLVPSVCDVPGVSPVLAIASLWPSRLPSSPQWSTGWVVWNCPAKPPPAAQSPAPALPLPRPRQSPATASSCAHWSPSALRAAAAHIAPGSHPDCSALMAPDTHRAKRTAHPRWSARRRRGDASYPMAWADTSTARWAIPDRVEGLLVVTARCSCTHPHQ